MLADKYRYRPPNTSSSRRISKRPGTVEPRSASTVIEQTNPGLLFLLFNKIY